MGTGNVTTNNSAFTAYSFNGTNNTAFNITNSTAVSDGYTAITVYYNDSATNTGSASIIFYIDNTPPSSVIGLKNSSNNGRYQPSSAQVIEVLVTDALKTNDTITLNYMTHGNQTWLTKTMTGTPGTSTVYATTIDTSGLINDEYVLYYITGVDNATNSISSSVGGSTSSQLANITISQYCGNNGTALAYCSYNGWQGLTTGAINTFQEVHWSTNQLSGASSLSGNYNISNVLSSISSKYSFVYYHNTSTTTPWTSYDPNIAWNLNTLRFGNNTNTEYNINVTTAGAVIRIA